MEIFLALAFSALCGRKISWDAEIAGLDIAGLDNDQPNNAGLDIDGLDISGRVCESVAGTRKHAQLLFLGLCSEVH